MHKVDPWQPTAAIIGIMSGFVAAYGAYEYAKGLKDTSFYLIVGATMVAGIGGLIPPMAKKTWKDGELLLSIMLWFCVLPVAAFVFYTAAERVHEAKEGSMAQNRAAYSKLLRAREDHSESKVQLAKAEAEESWAKGTVPKGRECDSIAHCREKVDLVLKARKRFEVAEEVLLTAEGKARSVSALRAPDWLLPACLDLLSFLSIWMAFSRPWVRKNYEGKLVMAAPTAVTKKERVFAWPSRNKPEPEKVEAAA